jgi:integrase/recombinase XerC
MKYVNDFIEYLKVIKKYSGYTMESYRKDIEDFYYFIDGKILDITYDDVSNYLGYLYDNKLNRNSISRHLSSIRSFYNYLIHEDIVKNNYFKEVSNPKKSKSLPRYIKDNDLEKMFLVFDLDDKLEQRNSLILEMLYATGVRVSELVNIKISDINFYDNTIKILGKGNKERIVIYGSFCRDALERYLNDGRKKLLKGDNDYLFLNKDGKKITERAIRKILNKIIEKASLEIHISPHMLRHTFATDMLNSGADLVSVKELLGHESLDTTSIYTHVSQEQVRKVYEMAHPRAKE